MNFYHGTDQKIIAVDLTKSRLRTDFGRGFYLSDKLGNARDWAIDKSGLSGIPTVMRYDIDKTLFQAEELNCLRFDKATIEWLNFVRDNRRKDFIYENKQNPRHSFDVVSGAIADDKVAIAVDKYCREKLSAEETLEEIKTIKDVFQLSLHTSLALTYIRSVSHSQYTNKRWSEWRNIGEIV